MNAPRAASRAQKYASRPYPNGWRSSRGRALRRWAMSRNRSLPLSASECEASAANAGELVTMAAPTFDNVPPMPATRAIQTVRSLPSAMTPDTLPRRPERTNMDLEQTLEKLVELAREELHVVRKRAEEKTPAPHPGKDQHQGPDGA